MALQDIEPREMSLDRIALARNDFMAVCRTVSSGLLALDREPFNTGALSGELVFQLPTTTGLKLARKDGKPEMASKMSSDRREGSTYRIGDRLFYPDNPLIINSMVATFALDKTVMMLLVTEAEHTIHDELKVNLDDMWRYSLIPFNPTLPEGHASSLK